MYHKLVKLVTKEITKSKVESTKRIQQHLINAPAWKDIKKQNGLPTSTSTTDHEIKFKPDDLNTFFAHFEKYEINKPNIDETIMTGSELDPMDSFLQFFGYKPTNLPPLLLDCSINL